MTEITTKLLVACSGKKDTLPAATDPKRASGQRPGQPPLKFAEYHFRALRCIRARAAPGVPVALCVFGGYRGARRRATLR